MNAISSVSSISLSGMQAAQTRLQSSAHNIANANTENFSRQEVLQEAEPAGGVNTSIKQAAVPGEALINDVVDQLIAKQDFLANLTVFKSSSKMLGALLDTKA